MTNGGFVPVRDRNVYQSLDSYFPRSTYGFPRVFVNKKQPWNPWKSWAAPARHPTRSDALQADVPSARWDHASPGGKRWESRGWFAYPSKNGGFKWFLVVYSGL